MEIRSVPEKKVHQNLRPNSAVYSFASNSAVLFVRIFKNCGKYEKITTYVKVDKNQETARQSVY